MRRGSSLRLRLTVVSTALLATAIALFGALVYAVSARTLDVEVDRALADRARVVIAQVTVAQTAAGLQVQLPDVDAIAAGGAVVQVTGFDGTIVRSALLGNATLPLSDTARAAALVGSTSFETSVVEGVRLRIASAPLAWRGETLGVLLVARPLLATDVVTGGLRLVLAGTGAVVLLVGAAGSWVVTRRALRPLDDFAREAGAIGQTQDFSRRLTQDVLASAAEVGALGATFNAMLDRLEQAFAATIATGRRLEATLASQRRFVADASHELRTPLTTIRGNAQLLQRDASIASSAEWSSLPREPGAESSVETPRLLGARSPVEAPRLLGAESSVEAPRLPGAESSVETPRLLGARSPVEAPRLLGAEVEALDATYLPRGEIAPLASQGSGAEYWDDEGLGPFSQGVGGLGPLLPARVQGSRLLGAESPVNAPHRDAAPREPAALEKGSTGLGTLSAADRSEMVDEISSEAERMARLVNDLLTLARADSGQPIIMAQPVMLRPLVESVALQARTLRGGGGVGEGAPGPSVSVVPFTGDGDLEVDGDPDALRQLLLALVDNAIKYTPPTGSVTLALSAGRVETPRVLGAGDSGGEAVASARLANVARLSVIDTGMGIGADDLPHVFERFFRADRARTVAGSGLGLSIARWITESHGGSITVESSVGGGSMFTVTLPARRVEPVGGPDADTSSH